MYASRVTLLLLLITFTAQSQQSWEVTIGIKNFKGGFRDIHFFDGQRAIAVGSAEEGTGIIVTTNDAFLHYVVQPRPETDCFNDIEFADSLNGWIVGNNFVILHTVDGGQTWETQAEAGEIDFLSVACCSKAEAWVAGEGGNIIHTQNGGEVFESQDVNSGYTISCIYFVDSLRGWVVGGSAGTDGRGVVLYTSNGGLHWREQSVPECRYLWSVFFLDDRTGWAAGGFVQHEEIILQTTDGGKIWKTQFIREYPDFIQSVFFLNRNEGWAIGAHGYLIMRTVDGGVNWEEQIHSISVPYFYSVVFSSSGDGWVAGETGIFRIRPILSAEMTPPYRENFRPQTEELHTPVNLRGQQIGIPVQVRAENNILRPKHSVIIR